MACVQKAVRGDPVDVVCYCGILEDELCRGKKGFSFPDNRQHFQAMLMAEIHKVCWILERRQAANCVGMRTSASGPQPLAMGADRHTPDTVASIVRIDTSLSTVTDQ